MYYVLVAPFSRTCDKLTALYLVLLERVGGQKHSSQEKQLYREGKEIYQRSARSCTEIFDFVLKDKVERERLFVS